MKAFFLSILLLFGIQLFAQEVEVDSLGFMTFEMTEGDTTYTMKQYFMVFLKAGEQRDQSEEVVAEIQKAHLAHMDSLANQGIIHIAGPFGDDGDFRGIAIYSVPTLADAKSLAEADPAVKAGRLEVIVRPWWAAVGSMLK